MQIIYSYLASGDAMNGLATRFRLGNSTVQDNEEHL